MQHLCFVLSTYVCKIIKLHSCAQLYNLLEVLVSFIAFKTCAVEIYVSVTIVRFPLSVFVFMATAVMGIYNF